MDDGGDRMRWAEALAIERLHGADASRWVADRIDVLASNGDAAGLARFREIARRLEQTFAATNDAAS